MKTTLTVFKYLTIVAVCGLTFISCGKDKAPDTLNPDAEFVLPANGVVDQRLFDERNNVKLSDGNTYILKGGVQLKSGQKITIEPGVTIKSDPIEPTPAYLLIGPGATIMAQGTATRPIVFTSGKASPKFGDWGGLIICGRAPVNTPGGTTSSEMGVGVTYGGTNPNDNSGILRYLRVEYTGAKQTPVKEHNGITFEGVGKGTVTEYLASYESGDDGFEWFGGTVDAKYLVCVGAKDDLYDWTFGWIGRAQFLVGIQADDAADRGIEADNNEDNHAATPFSYPIIANIILVGSTIARTGDDPLNPANPTGQTRMLELRRGTKGRIVNLVGYGFNRAPRVSNDQTLTNMQDGSLRIESAILNFATDRTWEYAPNAGTYAGPRPWEPSSPSVTYSNTSNSAPAGITSRYIGALDAANAIDPRTIDPWFSSAKFKGAVDPANNWITGIWARF